MAKKALAHSIFPSPIYLGAAVRTPIGKFCGSLKHLSAPELAALTLEQSFARAPEALKADTIYLGQARQAGAGPNPARQAVISAGFSDSVPAMTINQACASGLMAIICGAEKLALGRANSIWAGGVESMSNTPYLLPQARRGYRLGHSEILDGMWKDGFFCPMSQMVMGETVERYIAQELGVSREEQDHFAFMSQQRASNAWKSDAFKKEVFSVKIEGKVSSQTLDRDEHMRPETTLDELAHLIPVFDKVSGSITAGNSSGITDGAAFVHLGVHKASHTMAEILDYEIVALDPKRMGLGPVPATARLLKRQGLVAHDLESVELNEAFAAQVIACQAELKIPSEKLNPKGGAIALGHPIGATGARIMVTLMHTLAGKSGALGLSTLCVSGGMGVSVLISAV